MTHFNPFFPQTLATPFPCNFTPFSFPNFFPSPVPLSLPITFVSHGDNKFEGGRGQQRYSGDMECKYSRSYRDGNFNCNLHHCINSDNNQTLQVQKKKEIFTGAKRNESKPKPKPVSSNDTKPAIPASSVIWSKRKYRATKSLAKTDLRRKLWVRRHYRARKPPVSKSNTPMCPKNVVREPSKSNDTLTEETDDTLILCQEIDF